MLIERGKCPLDEREKVMATITPKELAAELGTDGRTIRKFLRSPQGLDAKVGKGQRWAIEAKQVRSLKAKFAKWDEARKAAPEALEAAADAPEVEVEVTD